MDVLSGSHEAFENADFFIGSLLEQIGTSAYTEASFEVTNAHSMELPDIKKNRATDLSAWPVILSILFDLADSDAVVSIISVSGLEVDWDLIFIKEKYSHRTRIRAYGPKIESAYQKLGPSDRATVLSIVAVELARRYPAKLETVRDALARVGWTFKTTNEDPSGSVLTPPIMKRDKELQRLLLIQLRDGKEPGELNKFSEAEQVYNSALLINDKLVEGEAIRGNNGEYVGTVMTALTSKGHDFLDAEQSDQVLSGDSTFPIELADSLKRFRKDFPDSSKCAFIMMRFGTTKAHDEILLGIRNSMSDRGLRALRADDKDYHDDLFWNILTYIYGCRFGIAVFERIEEEQFNPNIALEVGYMMALKKPVLLLKDRTLKNLNTDLMGKLYKPFDIQDIQPSITAQLQRWLKDKGIVQ